MPFALLDERDEQVLGLDLRVVHLLGELLRGGDGFLGLFGVLVDVHDHASRVSASASKCTRCSGVSERGQLHVDRRIEIPGLGVLADRRHAVALQAEHLAVLRRRRDLQAQRLAGERRHSASPPSTAVVSGIVTRV